MPEELRLVERGGFFHAHGTIRGERVRRSLLVPVGSREQKDLALRKMREVERTIREGKREDIALANKRNKTIGDAFDAYAAQLEKEGRLTKNTEFVIRKWSPLRSVRLDDLTSEMLIEHYDEFDNIKPGSLNRYIGTLSAALGFAKKLKWVEAVPDLVRPRYDNSRTVHLDNDQVKLFLALLKVKEPFFLPHFSMLIYSGARVSEMIAVTRKDFTKEEGAGWTVMIDKTARNESAKTKTQTRRVPIPEWLAKMALGMDADSKTGRIFITPEGASKPETVINRLLRVKNAICDVSPELARIGFTNHDLRHTFAWLWANAGADIADLKYLLGHTNISMSMRYRGFVKPRVNSIARKMHSGTEV